MEKEMQEMIQEQFPEADVEYTELKSRFPGDRLVGHHIDVKFKNGHGASLVQHDFSYTNEGEWELAVVDTSTNELVYDTPITDGVVGYLLPDDVYAMLVRISVLPDRADYIWNCWWESCI